MEKQLLKQEQNEETKKELESLKKKFIYVKKFPNKYKYISIVKEPSDEKAKV